MASVKNDGEGIGVGRLGSGSLVVALLVIFACATISQADEPAKETETIRVALQEGSMRVDVYWPKVDGPAPLVVAAHGFSRRRQQMAGWGRHLSEQGFVVLVPDLPKRSDHVANGRFIAELVQYAASIDDWHPRVDANRVGLIGFSAGGLSTLLAAADNPVVLIWVGLDPVDRDGLGAAAAPKVPCRTVALLAEPSPWNAHGNASGIIAALMEPEEFKVEGSVHVDAEWPTTWLAERASGKSEEAKRAEFRDFATRALVETLKP